MDVKAATVGGAVTAVIAFAVSLRIYTLIYSYSVGYDVLDGNLSMVARDVFVEGMSFVVAVLALLVSISVATTDCLVRRRMAIVGWWTVMCIMPLVSAMCISRNTVFLLGFRDRVASDFSEGQFEQLRVQLQRRRTERIQYISFPKLEGTFGDLHPSFVVLEESGDVCLIWGNGFVHWGITISERSSASWQHGEWTAVGEHVGVWQEVQ